MEIMYKMVWQVIILLLCFCAPAHAQPNIVLIQSDDQSNQAVGAYGNPKMKTPHMDRLAHEGVRFAAAYNMGCWSPAVCIPSRTMLMYGKYIWEARKVTATKAPLSLPERLKGIGYSTYMTGKWHAYGKKPQSLFDRVGKNIQPGQLKTYYTQEGHATDITGQEAVDFINGHQSRNPFFLYVAFNAPHVPRQTAQKYYDMYPLAQVELPPSVQEGPLNPNIAHNYSPSPLKKTAMKNRVRQNNAMVTHMDEQVGRILAALEATGHYGNTIVVFMSDHGISFGENGVAGKVCLYEPSVTAPMIIKAPGVPPGKVVADRVYLQDIHPTLLRWAGIPVPASQDFQPLQPIINGKEKGRTSIYLAMMDDQRAVVANGFKLLLYPKSGDLELYNLRSDPWETQNIADSQEARPHTHRLLKTLAQWQQKTGDTLDISTPYTEYWD